MARGFMPVFAGDALPSTPQNLRRSNFNGSPPANIIIKGEDNDDADFAHHQTNGVHSSGFGDIDGGDSATVAPNGAAKIFRQPGGRPVTFKRLGDDLDEEDSIIKQMKDAGYHDDKVAEQLIEQGLTVYNPKSIATRYQRIRRMERQRENQRLDDELTDWHEGDDDLLKDSISYHIQKYNREMEKAKETFYESVSDTLHAKQNLAGRKVAFSKNACRERDEALKIGTALPELELDPNQLIRSVQREQRFYEIEQTRQHREEERQKKIAEKQAAENARIEAENAAGSALAAKEAAREAKHEAQMTDKAKADALTDYFRLRNYAKKEPAQLQAEEGRLQDIMEAISKKEIDRRMEVEEQMAAEAEEADRVKKARAKAKQEEEAVKKMMKRIRRENKKTTDVEAIITDDVNRLLGLGSEDELSDADSDTVVALDTTHKRKFQAIKVQSDTDSEDDLTKKSGGRRMTISAVMEQKIYSWFPANNPRGKLSVAALRTLSERRNIVPVGDKRQLIFQLARADEDATHQKLKEILTARGVSAMGTKNELMNRLALDDAGNLVHGSDYYTTEIDPKRKRYRTFGSLTPDGEVGTSAARRRDAMFIDSDEDEESDVEEEQDGVAGADKDDEQLAGVAETVEVAEDADSDA